jgi:hypothetical protein
MMIGSGLQALTTLGKFKPMVLGEIQAAGDSHAANSVDALRMTASGRAFIRGSAVRRRRRCGAT